MNCANCKYNDGFVYTSFPPRFKCTITDEFHEAYNDCNVEFMPVRHGRWIDENVTTGTTSGATTVIRKFRCSVCGSALFGGPTDNYCYKCGARMDLEDES